MKDKAGTVLMTSFKKLLTSKQKLKGKLPYTKESICKLQPHLDAPARKRYRKMHHETEVNVPFQSHAQISVGKHKNIMFKFFQDCQKQFSF